MRTRFNLNAICRANGSSEIYEVTHRAHKKHLIATRTARLAIIEQIPISINKLTCAKDLIGKTTIIFKKRVLITKDNAELYWNAYGENINLL